MKDEYGFFYPHNLDFHGRAYPTHPHLNHLGSDLCRGILKFSDGRPLGKTGLRWLKIHLANLYASGVDKLSYGGRVAFTEMHVDDIFVTADWPLEGKRWWLGAEDPFQCLAACINLAEALRSSSPETTISHMPVHQDGSCDGLQHYAALGRDKSAEVQNMQTVRGLRLSMSQGYLAKSLDMMQVLGEFAAVQLCPSFSSPEPATKGSCYTTKFDKVELEKIAETVSELPDPEVPSPAAPFLQLQLIAFLAMAQGCKSLPISALIDIPVHFFCYLGLNFMFWGAVLFVLGYISYGLRSMLPFWLVNLVSYRLEWA
ncbi:hypothetical protein Vadar_003597 [Vaccinium darrowii]|uniref:Uncharacterized protein n=1 Tax=Vaccinium darrowii TaxID=229202 RepID=A0ACB7Y517_9ERIC|nr:hypothetical protein Vadar_003597 [Vaccinium darrowii]